MKTKIYKIKPKRRNLPILKECSEIIKKGNLVAFPTETVYGLGANALNSKAVSKIFKAKGRPSDNPLIVHVSNMEMVEKITKEINSDAKKLIDKFWPGPITLILKSKKNAIPANVTCNLPTVGIRMPHHPLALELINLSNVPIAAPSANISGKISGTSGKHVIEDLNGKVHAIINAGDTYIGLESTVIDVTSKKPILLRPGGITREEIEKCLKKKIILAKTNSKKPKSPGMKYRHYAPKTSFILVKSKTYPIMYKKINKIITESLNQNKKLAVIGSNQTKKKLSLTKLCTYYSTGERHNLRELASKIFKLLREVDKKKYDAIVMGACSEAGLGLAIMNRLKKASTKII